MIKKYELQGKQIDDVISIINHDDDYRGTTHYYWLSVPVSFDNVLHYIRFPYGSEITIIVNDNNIVEKVY